MKAGLFVILAAVTSASHRCVIDVVSQVLDKERRGPHHPSSASLCSHWPAGDPFVLALTLQEPQLRCSSGE